MQLTFDQRVTVLLQGAVRSQCQYTFQEAELHSPSLSKWIGAEMFVCYESEIFKRKVFGLFLNNQVIPELSEEHTWAHIGSSDIFHL